MEHTSVIIVGAGPAGLVLGLTLAKLRVRSVILEKEKEITDDPRGVYLAGDAVRVFWSLGVQEEFEAIGQESPGLSFHKGSLAAPPQFRMQLDTDWRQQAVPDAIMQVQPELERILRRKIEASGYCQIRCECEVVSIEELENGMSVGYRTAVGDLHRLKGDWLVGADGKKGYVRKNHLEPHAGVRQETGLFAYEGTWIAANLVIKLPTPQSHPGFPLWALGMTPQNVYDLFWPRSVNFVSPPAKPTATMRFGPVEARWWRHEFAEPDWNDSKNAEELLWKELMPMLTRDHDGQGNVFVPTTYPQDCIEVRRCGPYSFSQKVVNKWFHNRTILIGDAAHVFPPFGGQGIAAGIKDAHELAWRLAMFVQLPNLSNSTRNDMLLGWSYERKQGIDDSARFTKQNGDMANHGVDVAQISTTPSSSHLNTEIERAEYEAYKSVKGGFFSERFNGGGKVAQIYLQQPGQEVMLSDHLLVQNRSLMTLVALCDSSRPELEAVLTKVGLPELVISKESIVQLNFDMQDRDRPGVYHACSEAQLPRGCIRKGYKPQAYPDRFGAGVRYAILRFDFIVYACARDTIEVEQSLEQLKLQLCLRNGTVSQ